MSLVKTETYKKDVLNEKQIEELAIELIKRKYQVVEMMRNIESDGFFGINTSEEVTIVLDKGIEVTFKNKGGLLQ